MRPKTQATPTELIDPATFCDAELLVRLTAAQAALKRMISFCDGSGTKAGA